MTYNIFYVENASSRVTSLKSLASLRIFLKEFVEKYGSLDDKGDNWIEHVYYGKQIDITQVLKLKRSPNGSKPTRRKA